jgi:YD repeat-containing protein
VRETADAQADSVGLASTLDTYGEHLFNGSYPDVQVSGRGNRIIHAYDGAGRLTTTTRNLTSDGSGNGSVVDTIVITREYDQASRLIAQIDDNGNRTEYAYDMLDRRTVARNADGTQKLFFFDRVGNLRITRDERGVVATMTVDVLGRTTGTSVARLPFGPGQTSYETFSYDGASRLVRGENNHAIVELRYDVDRGVGPRETGCRGARGEEERLSRGGSGSGVAGASTFAGRTGKEAGPSRWHSKAPRAAARRSSDLPGR